MAARKAGLDVTVIEVDEHPLARVLGPEVGALFADLHTSHGVRLLTADDATEFVGDSGRVAAVRTRTLADVRRSRAGTTTAATACKPHRVNQLLSK